MTINYHDDIFLDEEGRLMRFLRLQFPLGLSGYNRKQAITFFVGTCANYPHIGEMSPQERRALLAQESIPFGYVLQDVDARLLGSLGKSMRLRGAQ